MGPTPKCHFVLGLLSGSLEIPKVRILATFGAHNFVCKPLIEMRSKAKLYPFSKCFQRYVAHHLDARKLKRILTFSSGLFFGYNLCFKCPNGSCEPILNIYILRSFQWYKEILNLIGFGPCNFSLKIQKSIGTPTPEVVAHLGVWGFIPSHSPTLTGTWDVTLRLPSWPTPLQALALVTSPRLGLRQIV
jgi:hypothetical protein